MATAKHRERVRVEDDGRIALPADVLRQLGWKPGDELSVGQVHGMVTLLREPVDWVGTFAGKMGDVFGDHEENMRYLDEERASWQQPGNDERR